jgi:hypothetical protein
VRFFTARRSHGRSSPAPHRNFTSGAKGLANSWPASGPKKLWSRELGERSDAWTAPSLVGTTLYVRDRHTLMALDLR